MKHLKNLSLLGVASLTICSCGVMDKIQQPLAAGEFDPLDRPGFGKRHGKPAKLSGPQLANTNSYGFKNGDVVEVAITNTALFNNVPKPGERYKRVLKKGETLRVVGGQGDFIKVVTEKGETGYVSSVMVVSQGYMAGIQPFDPVADGQAPLVPDIAPEPEIKGIGEPDTSPIVPPVPVPSISDPVPVPLPVTPPAGGAAPLVPSSPAAPAGPSGGKAPEPEVPGIGE